MSLTALRWSAVPLGLLAFALSLTHDLAIKPLTLEMDGVTGLLLRIMGGLVALAIPIAILVLLDRKAGRPARFTAKEGRFTAPQHPTLAAGQAILWMFLGPGLITLEGRWDSAIALGITLGAALAFLLVRRPQLHLDPEGLTLRQLLRTTRLTWDQLIPGNPTPPGKKDPSLRVFIHGTPIHGMYPSVQIPVQHLHIDPAFLADALRHYGEHPEDRASIGTGEAPVLYAPR